MNEKELSEFGVTCKRCKLDFAIFADEKDICHWNDGAFIQDVLGYLSASERELLISGNCGDCFDKMFPPSPLDNQN